MDQQPQLDPLTIAGPVLFCKVTIVFAGKLPTNTKVVPSRGVTLEKAANPAD